MIKIISLLIPLIFSVVIGDVQYYIGEEECSTYSECNALEQKDTLYISDPDETIYMCAFSCDTFFGEEDDEFTITFGFVGKDTNNLLIAESGNEELYQEWVECQEFEFGEAFKENKEDAKNLFLGNVMFEMEVEITDCNDKTIVSDSIEIEIYQIIGQAISLYFSREEYCYTSVYKDSITMPLTIRHSTASYNNDIVLSVCRVFTFVGEWLKHSIKLLKVDPIDNILTYKDTCSFTETDDKESVSTSLRFNDFNFKDCSLAQHYKIKVTLLDENDEIVSIITRTVTIKLLPYMLPQMSPLLDGTPLLGGSVRL